MIWTMILIALALALAFFALRMRDIHLKVGDRVQTPSGPGTIRGFAHDGLICAVEHDEESDRFHRLQEHEAHGVMPIARRAGYFYAPQLLKRIG